MAYLARQVNGTNLSGNGEDFLKKCDISSVNNFKLNYSNNY